MNGIKNIDYRFLARIVLEAATPLSVKTGDKDVYTDAVVMTDVNGLPYIPGSSLAGVMRHAWHDLGQDDEDVFGFQKKDIGHGSRVIFSEARILNSKGEVADGLCGRTIDDDLLKHYSYLPIRQHVRINHRGVAEKAGKFDEEVVFSGSRFCFEMELLGQKEDEELFKSLMNVLYGTMFRLGSGTRSGFGEIRVVSVCYIGMGIADERYLSKSSNLEESKNWWKGEKDSVSLEEKPEDMEWVKYTLTLRPDDFFLFSSGFGDDEADMVPVKEPMVKWDNGKGKMEDHYYLLPASSIKGAIAHRVAFHYNKLLGIFADDVSVAEQYTGKNNEAVRLLFGSEGSDGTDKLRGNVILSDLFVAGQEKIFNHVAIDRFTGGTIDGALFSEKVVYNENLKLRMEIWVKNAEMHPGEEKEIGTWNQALKAFELTLHDICNGLLPLGGGVNRGNGLFSGEIRKGGVKL